VRNQNQRGEAVQLRRRVRQLENESEIARRMAAFDDQGPGRGRIWRFIENESENFPVTVLCRVCRVSRSTYYEWINKGEGPSEAELDEAILANKIYDIWAKSRRRYGAPRITAALCKGGDQVNEKRVARLMGVVGIAGICGRKKIKTTRRDPSTNRRPTWSSGTSVQRGPMSCGSRTSPTSPPTKDGSICARSSTCSHVDCSGGPWPITCEPSCVSTPSMQPSWCADIIATSAPSCTRITGVSSQAMTSTSTAPRRASSSRWAQSAIVTTIP
jgi:hypothetical protein